MSDLFIFYLVFYKIYKLPYNLRVLVIVSNLYFNPFLIYSATIYEIFFWINVNAF
jgi:hypothetical protein